MKRKWRMHRIDPVKDWPKPYISQANQIVEEFLSSGEEAVRIEIVGFNHEESRKLYAKAMGGAVQKHIENLDLKNHVEMEVRDMVIYLRKIRDDR